MTVRSFRLPDVGEGVTEGELVAWLVEPGERVTEDQPVADVETDKSIVEIPSPYDGTVTERLVDEGTVVPVGEEIIRFEVDEAAAEAESGADETTDTAAETTDESDTDSEAAGDSEAVDEVTIPEGRVFAPPRVRRLARELGVDITAVDGSEQSGRISERDVREAAEADEKTEATPGPKPFTPSGKSAVSKGGESVSGAGLAGNGATTTATTSTESETQAADATAVPPESETGKQMARSTATIPHRTHHDTATVSELVSLRDELEPLADAQGVGLTSLPFVMKAIVRALSEHPRLNATLDEATEEIVRRDEYHIGIAVATDAGLLSPVVRDVDEKTILELAEEIVDLTERAKNRELSRDETQGGTFTITDFGAIGGEYATPIINHPETAIIGLGAIEKRPVVEDGDTVVARETLPLSLSVDHRVVDGPEGAAFANRVIEFLENPNRLLLGST